MYTEELKNNVNYIINNINPSFWSKRTLKIKPYYDQIVNSTTFLYTNERLCVRLYCIMNNIISYPKCEICQLNQVKYEWLGKLRGFKKYCGRCQHKSIETQQKTILTTLNKYGVKNIAQTEYFKNKYKDTMIKKYGVEHPMHIKEIQNKCKNTRLSLYGVENSFKGTEIGKNETYILNQAELTYNCKIIRQYRIGKYFADGYCQSTNSVYEVYEKFHKFPYKMKKDKIRQNYIQEKLKCNFIIIWDNNVKPMEYFPYNTLTDLEY